MKQIALLISLAFTSQFCFGQPTQAETDKRIQAAKLEIEKLKKDPRYAEVMKSMPNIDSLMKLKKTGTSTSGPKTKATDTSYSALPPTNTTLLNALPLRTFNKAELVSYLHNLDSKLTGLLRTSYATDITAIPENTIRRSGTSIAFWANGQPYESVLTALKASELNPDNTALLNNSAGILTSSGLAVNAVPLLQYANQQQPGNNMIENNLGQAYFSLGDMKKAEQYLLQCISHGKYYPDANLALAYIYNKKGNTAAAIAFAENSLRGAYSTDAHVFLLKLKPKARLMDYIRHRYKQPLYFNFHKYPLLRPCLKVEDAPVLKPQYDAYHEMMFALSQQYDRMGAEEHKIAVKTGQEVVMKAMKEHRLPFRPFGVFAIAVLGDLNVEYADKFIDHSKQKDTYHEEIKKLDAKYEAEMKALDDRWRPILDDLETGSPADEAASKKVCAERNAIGNNYLPQYDSLIAPFQRATILLYSNYLNDWSYWSFIASVDEHSFNDVFYSIAGVMIETLDEINTTKFIFPCETTKESLEGKGSPLQIQEPDCFLPAKVVLPLGAINLEISCDGYKLEAGEGFIGKIEYSMQSGDVTIAFGVGAKAPKIIFEGGGVEAGGEAEAKSQFYITLNKGRPTDWGILWEAEMKAKIGVGGVETTIGVEEGLTAGFGSGVQMRDGGPLKGFIDKMYPVQPADKQINKNVPLYKK